MITLEFGKSEKTCLDRNSIFIKFMGSDFKQNLDKIKKFWIKAYLKDTKEWEVPFSCYNEILELYKDTTIKYINEPPKAHFISKAELLTGMDFNGYNLYDYQLEGVKFGLNHNNFILLDEQGLGKTLQAITLARYKKLHRGLKHCLIVCGVNSLKWNWQREISKFCVDEQSVILGTRINTRNKIVPITIQQTIEQIDTCPEQFFWIINIEKMRCTNKEYKEGNTIIHALNKQIQQQNLGMLIVDECHKIKNIQSAQAQGLLNLDKSISKMLMSGTILVNSPADLFCPMAICGLVPPNKWLFEKTYFEKDEYGQVYGYKNMKELHNIFFKNSLRRTKDILDLPPKIYKQEWLEPSDEESDVLEQLYGNKEFKLDRISQPFEVLSILTRIRQATVAAELLTSQCKTSTKFNRLNDILEEAKLNNQKVLVFCPFTEALKLGLNYCSAYKPKLVIGGMNSEIQKVVDDHENSEGFSVIFAQEATLGVGYTLKNTSIVVFLSPPWSQASYDQCIDRTHRIGQKNTVQIIDLLMINTYDELIYKKLHGKGAMSKVLIDGEEIDSVKQYLNDMNISFKEDDTPKVQQPKLFN